MSEPARKDDVPLDIAERRVGTVISGKWTLKRLLGVGGMAAVYEAVHRNGARAAIKLFPFGVTTSAELAERFLREGYLANKIKHRGAVRVLDDHIDYDTEQAYLVMELLEGETARDRLDRLGPLSPLEAIDLMLALCDCLHAAHAHGVVHRDIKPENLFITKDNELKVLDFGVARALDAQSNLTRTGAALGTPAYMSPEQARGKQSEVSAKSDIYSTGATLLFLLSGRMLHDGETAQELMVRAAWTPPVSAAVRCPELPPGVVAVIDRACAFDPAARYADIADFARDLHVLRSELSASSQGHEPVAQCAQTPTAFSVTPAEEAPALSHRTTMDAAPAVPPSTSPAAWLVGSVLTAVVIAGIVFVYPSPEERQSQDVPASSSLAARSATLSPSAEHFTRETASTVTADFPAAAPAKAGSATRPTAVLTPSQEVPARAAEKANPPSRKTEKQVLSPTNTVLRRAPPVPTGRDVGY